MHTYTLICMGTSSVCVCIVSLSLGAGGSYMQEGVPVSHQWVPGTLLWCFSEHSTQFSFWHRCLSDLHAEAHFFSKNTLSYICSFRPLIVRAEVCYAKDGFCITLKNQSACPGSDTAYLYKSRAVSRPRWNSERSRTAKFPLDML